MGLPVIVFGSKVDNMIRSRPSAISFALLVSLAIVPASLATPIIGAVSATTNMGELQPDGNLVHAINQSGLLSAYTSGVTDFDAYMAGDPGHFSFPGNDWLTITPTGVVDFNLGSVLPIGRMAVWNFGGNTAFDFTQIHLFGSLDAAFLTPVDLGTFNLVVPTINPVGAQILSFSSTSVQYIRMQVVANNGADRSALGEVAFAAASVPEPSSLSLAFAAAFTLCLSSLVRQDVRA